MKKSRVPDIAFTTSSVSVVVSFAASNALPMPDLPGIVLVVTGGLAVVLSLRRRLEREFQILAALVVLAATLVVLHRVFRRLGVAHDWLGPPYAGVILVYCVMSISTSRRLFRRNTDRPPA